MKYLFTFLCIFLFTTTSFSQLVLERDINQEAASSSPDFFTELNNVLYFQADDGIHGEELYSFDITSGTSQLVANLRAYEAGSGISQVIAFDEKIYFGARDDVGNDRHLYVHDPTDNSTQRVMDSQGEDVVEPFNFFIFENKLFFSAEFGNDNKEVGFYDPVANEIKMIADLNPNGGSAPNFFNEANGQLWFIANAGSQVNSRLWRYDPTTEAVENIVYESPDDKYPSMSFLKYFDGQFFFQGFIQGEGSELWIYDMATNSLLDVPQIYPGQASSSPNQFTELGGKLYFKARDSANGWEMRVYDPADETVSVAVDVNPMDESNPSDLYLLDNRIYFVADNGDGKETLHSYDPDMDALQAEGTLDNNGASSFLAPVAVADGALYLSGTTLATGRELFRFNPNVSGIELAADINQLTIGSDPYEFTEYNGKLYFGADEINSGREIWVYDPTTGSVDLLSDVPGNTTPNGFTVLDGKLFFAGQDATKGYGLLYYSDVDNEIYPTSFLTPGNTGHIDEIIAFNGLLYLSANDEMLGDELHVYDPATNMVSIVEDINAGDDSHPAGLFIFENELYFRADDGITGLELWKYNDISKTVVQVADLNPGEGDSRPKGFTAYAGELYFNANVNPTGLELYSYNPLTEMITQRTDVSGSLGPEGLTVYKDKLFFSGFSSSQVNVELMYYDAATNELELTEDLTSGASNPRDLVVFNDKLYISTFTDTYGRELWEYNDTALAIVADIYSGVPSGDPTYLTLFNDKLYFSANDGNKGTELWSLAECLNVFVDTEPQVGENGVGAIDLSIQGGQPPYIITWSNGAMTEDIDELQPGLYSATIADASGCLSEITAEVTFVSSTEELLDPEALQLFPNPATETFKVQSLTLDLETIEVYDLSGRLLYQNLNLENQEQVEVQLNYAPSGMYLVKVQTKNGMISKKLMRN